MRHVTHYIDGKPQWSENEHAGPAKVSGWGSALISVVGGSFVGPGESVRDRELRLQRENKARQRRIPATVDDRVRKNPDNGAVEASITEVHP